MSSEEIKEALAVHNAARHAAAGVKRPDLTWDENLAADARKWAQHLSSIDKMQHQGMKGEGENLFMMFGGSHQPFKKAVEDWINEKKDYHGEKIGEGNFAKYGHYTQVIWPATTHVGMASVTRNVNGQDHQIIVARYQPQGNFMGKTAYEK